MLLQENGRSLTDFKSMPRPNVADMPSFTNKLIVDELNYNEDELEKTHADIVFFFLYGYGGTGKTFIWKTLSTAIRSKGLIVLNVASSGIETLLLPGGRTAHSKLAVPIEIKEASSLTMEKDSPRADLVCAAKLIIFYESPMMHQWCFEKVYRSMCDIMSKNDPLNKFRPFRGMIVVLGGDFRQILPVVREATRHDIVNALINSSKIWAYCNMLRLTVNMRLGASSLPAEQEEIANFGKWILSIRDGNDASDENGKMKVEIPEDFLISDTTNPLMSLIDVYPDLNDNLGDPLFFQERGILAPTLDSVEHVNEYMMSLIPGEEKEYLSSDSLCRSGENSDVQREWFTTEFLNGIKSYGIPNHRLKLRAGCPVMLMRNIDQTNGLSNGTRLTVTHIGKSTIAATIITGKREGTRVFIPRMNLIPRSIFTSSGIYLPKPVFTHGQLYVAVSRVTSRKGLKLLILDKDNNVCKETTNVVYCELFQKAYWSLEDMQFLYKQILLPLTFNWCTFNCGVLMECATKKKMHLVNIVLPKSMPGARPLSALISLGCYMPTKRRRYMPTSVRLQETSNAQARLQETSYAPEHNQETSDAQAQLQKTSKNSNRITKNMFEVEHLIYNQWCSQYKSDQTLKTLEFLRYELL
ncbi:PIF1-like helicase [Medicago truncatula]|uniref:ATP-dependent DNA helicase n=1 Tax=Medicago truncatula TaxID=3880 RepID=G7I6F3_MEDTR|nr:PIF1-like helicase [Medicago truncatula]